MISPVRLLSVLLVVMVALVLGCAGAEAPTPTATSRPAAPSPAAPAPAASPTAAPTRQAVASPAPATPGPAITPTVAGGAPQGTFVGVVGSFATVTGWAPNCTACSQLPFVSAAESLFTTRRSPQGDLELAPWLVESWKNSPDMKYTDLKLREGVQFHKGFGELTAEDVAWYFNLLNVVTNPA